MNEDRPNLIALGAMKAAMTTACTRWLSEPSQVEICKALLPVGIQPHSVRSLLSCAFAAGYQSGGIDSLTLLEQATKQVEL